MKILVVDDEPDIRSIIKAILERHGFFVLEASDGKKALEVIEKDERKEITCVITDYLMPRLNGIELCHFLREMHKHVICIILVTAYGLNVQNSIRKDFDESIGKPIDFDNLIEKIRIHGKKSP